jgi:hypothetical protein
MSTTTAKQIKAALGFSRTLDPDVVARGHAVFTGLNGNPNYDKPPVDLAVFKTAVDNYAAAIAAGLDGGKKAISDRKKRRHEVITMMRLLGHYVEATCKNDMAIFTSSGFQAASTTRTPPQPLPQPTIEKIDQGTTGKLVATIKALRKARNYELRYAALGGGGMPGSWTIITLTSARPAVPISGLTPGTTYAFQVRALGKLGHTDWSDSATRMCI